MPQTVLQCPYRCGLAKVEGRDEVAKTANAELASNRYTVETLRLARHQQVLKVELAIRVYQLAVLRKDVIDPLANVLGDGYTG
jgi:hypothetical protein